MPALDSLRAMIYDALKMVIGGFPEASTSDGLMPCVDKLCSMTDVAAVARMWRAPSGNRAADYMRH
eukprot:2030837-Pyramimonas_sp.AAC.1